MQPVDDSQEHILNEMKLHKMPVTFRCANCGVYQGEEHKPECPGPKPVVMEVPKQ